MNDDSTRQSGVPPIIGPQSARKTQTDTTTPAPLSAEDELHKRDLAQHSAEDELAQALREPHNSVADTLMQKIQPKKPAPRTSPQFSQPIPITKPKPLQTTQNDLESGDVTRSPFAIEKNEHISTAPQPITPKPDVPHMPTISTPVPTPQPIISSEPIAPIPSNIQAPQHVQPTPAPTSSQRVPSDPKLKTLRTFQGDMAGVVRTKGESVATIAVAAHKKREERGESIPLSAARTIPFFKNTFFLISSVAVIGIGAFSLYTVFFAKHSQNTAIHIRQPETPVQYNTFEILPFTIRETFITQIIQGKQLLPETNASIWLAIVQDTRAEDVLRRITPQAPDALLRTIKDPYAIGFYRERQVPRFFAVWSTHSYGQTFASMLQWEPSLYNHLINLLPQSSVPVTEFIDIIIDNKDIRVLRDEQGITRIVYGFADQETLVIAENEQTFRAIVNNILTKRTAR